MALKVKGPQRVKDQIETKRDVVLQNLATKTPAEISTFVDTEFAQLNVTQRRFLKVLAMTSVQYIRERLED